MDDDSFVKEKQVRYLTETMIAAVNALEFDPSMVGQATDAALSALASAGAAATARAATETARDVALARVDVLEAPAKAVLDDIMGGDVSGLAAKVADKAGDRGVVNRPGSGVNIVSGSLANSVTGGTANAVLAGGTTGNPNIISGGNETGTSGAYRTIAGGYDNKIDSTGVGADVIGGGAHHRIAGVTTHGTISGGSYSSISAGDYGTIGGGTQCNVSASGATIAGGRINTASGQDATISGGVGNTASGQNANIAGGINNLAGGPGSTVGGGNGNKSYGRNSYVGSGDGNTLGTSGSSLGDYGAIGGGFRNLLGTITSARYSAIPGGRECSVQHEYATASGFQAVSRQTGAEVRALGSFATPGDAQAERLVLRRQTTDATPTVLAWNGLAAPPIIPASSTFLVEGTVLARRTDTPGTNRAWHLSGMVVRDAGVARVVGASFTNLATEGEASAWDCTLTGGGSTININGTGALGHTVRWVAQVTLTEIAQ